MLTATEVSRRSVPRAAEGPSALSTVRLAKTVLNRVCATDDVGWYDENHLGALLPDTAANGAWRFADQVCGLATRRGPRPLLSVYCYPTKWFGDDELAYLCRPPSSPRVGRAKSPLRPKPDPVLPRRHEFRRLPAECGTPARDVAGPPAAALEGRRSTSSAPVSACSRSCR